MKYKESQRTLATLACANALANALAMDIIGNEVADTLEGQPITRPIIDNLQQTAIQKAVAPQLRGA